MDEVYESAPWLFAMLKKRFNNGTEAAGPEGDAQYSTLGSPLLLQSGSGPVVEHPDGETGPEISEIQEDRGFPGGAVAAAGLGGAAAAGAFDYNQRNQTQSSFEMYLPKKNRPTGNNEDIYGGYVLPLTPRPPSPPCYPLNSPAAAAHAVLRPLPGLATSSAQCSQRAREHVVWHQRRQLQRDEARPQPLRLEPAAGRGGPAARQHHLAFPLWSGCRRRRCGWRGRALHVWR